MSVEGREELATCSSHSSGAHRTSLRLYCSSSSGGGMTCSVLLRTMSASCSPSPSPDAIRLRQSIAKYSGYLSLGSALVLHVTSSEGGSCSPGSNVAMEDPSKRRAGRRPRPRIVSSAEMLIGPSQGLIVRSAVAKPSRDPTGTKAPQSTRTVRRLVGSARYFL